MTETKINQNQNLNFFTISKKYWKKQLIFSFLATLSFLFSFVIKKNAAEKIYDVVKGKEKKLNFSLLWKDIYTFTNWQTFACFMAGVIGVYFLIVMVHVYYRFYFANKIVYDVKRNIVRKILQIQGNWQEEEALNALTYEVRNFADMVVYVPNQIYIIMLSAIFTFIGLNKARDNVLGWGSGYSFLIMLVCLVLDYLLYRKDLLFQKQLERQTKKENILINNRNLIIKKGLLFNFQKEYQPIVARTRKVANQNDFFYTAAFVVPSYLLIKLADLIFLPSMSSKKSFIALGMLLKLFDELKKMIERLWSYPYYFSAKKRLNKFLAREERDDIQNNLVLSEPITVISFQEISFAYEPDNLVLKKNNYQFQKGKLNLLTGVNGFGKSTIISLLTGLYKPSVGKIIINNNYQLSDLNLHAWRDKIAYAEHSNLVTKNLSTGQKQLVDIENIFTKESNKEIFIFDEADNSLDEKNRQKFQHRCEKLSRKKVVILISHQSKNK